MRRRNPIRGSDLYRSVLQNDRRDSTISQETKVKILENLGRACAKEHAISFEKFKGDPESS
jgi:hypothetical protein